MGACLTVRARTAKDRDRMQDFLTKHFRPWTKVIEHIPLETRGLFLPQGEEPSSEVSYRNPHTSIGFGKLAHGWERDYQFAVCRWIALQVGRQKMRFSKEDCGGTTDKPVPFIVYDDIDSWPVFLCTSKQAKALGKKQRQWAVDRFGVYVNPDEDCYFMTCSLYLRDPAFVKDMDALGPCPSGGPAHYEYMKAWLAIKRKHAKGEIEANVPILRAEIARLDKAWANYVK